MSGFHVAWIACALSFVLGAAVTSAWWAGWPLHAVYLAFLAGVVIVIMVPVVIGEPSAFTRIE